MKLHENMKYELLDFVMVKYDRFVNNFSIFKIIRNKFHDKRWKESKTKLVKVVECILGIL